MDKPNNVITPRFDSWETVKECSNCQRWWNDQCDGTPQGSVKPCKDFLATRNVKIPEEIESLKMQIKGLRVSAICISVAGIIHLISHLIGG